MLLPESDSYLFNCSPLCLVCDLYCGLVSHTLYTVKKESDLIWSPPQLHTHCTIHFISSPSNRFAKLPMNIRDSLFLSHLSQLLSGPAAKEELPSETGVTPGIVGAWSHLELLPRQLGQIYTFRKARFVFPAPFRIPLLNANLVT